MLRSVQKETAKMQALYDRGVPVKEIVRRGNVSLSYVYNRITTVPKAEKQDKQKLAEVITIRLAELRQSQMWLAKQAGVTHSSVYLYLQARYIPKKDILKKIYAALSIEYAPIDEVYEHLEQSAKEKGYDSLPRYRLHLAKQKPPTTKLSEIIRTRLAELGKSRRWLAEETDRGRKTIGKYISGKWFPPKNALEKILSALGLKPTPLNEVYENLVRSVRRKGFDSLEEYRVFLNAS